MAWTELQQSTTVPVNRVKIMKELGKTHTGTGRTYELWKDPNRIRNLFGNIGKMKEVQAPAFKFTTLKSVSQLLACTLPNPGQLWQ